MGYYTRIDLYRVQVHCDQVDAVRHELAAAKDGPNDLHWMVGLLKLHADGSLSWNDASEGKWKTHDKFIEWLAPRCASGVIAFWSCEGDGAAWAYEFDGAGGYQECPARRVSGLKAARTREKRATAIQANKTAR
ncbi:MAG: hypothetical protein KY475_22715 [Planctomycetes bacterium]|nr:hypothetical protein [Planctomycetota bacterium]